jgi:hypothetical protein
MGENIADLGGVLVALDAYKTSLDGKPAPVIDGLTGEQRVFLGWAQVWRTKFRDDALRQQVVTGPHSPGAFRSFGPLRNIDAWYTAFDVKPGDPLYLPPNSASASGKLRKRSTRAQVWPQSMRCRSVLTSRRPSLSRQPPPGAPGPAPADAAFRRRGGGSVAGSRKVLSAINASPRWALELNRST